MSSPRQRSFWPHELEPASEAAAGTSRRGAAHQRGLREGDAVLSVHRPDRRKARRMLGAVLALVVVLGAGAGAQTYLGRLSRNPYAADSTANRYGPYGSPFGANSVRNRYGVYGSPFSPRSATNPYATQAPLLFDGQGRFRGVLSANPYDPDSIANPFGRYGSPFSPESVSNPYGAGNPYASDSPTNPYGEGWVILGR